MSNISTARAAMIAELQHAKKGMAFYAARIVTVEKLLAQLEGVDAQSVPAEATAHPGPRKSMRAASAIQVQDDPAAETGKASLPATRGDFWKNLVTEAPMSNKDILKAATVTLKIRPNPDAVKKLKQRLANALTMMTKDGSIKSDGTGRARRFSRVV